MNTPLMQQIMQNLSPGEQQELQSAISYITEQHGGPLPEGNLPQVLNRLSPRVRSQFEIINQMLDTPRNMPFQPKMDTNHYAEALGADPAILQGAKSSLDEEFIKANLQNRMGTDASLSQPQEPSLRELISEAYHVS